MKNVKMWANTNEEAKSIINCALAHNLSYAPVAVNDYSKGGFYFNEGVLTHSARDDRKYFDNHKFEEFFFATPVVIGNDDLGDVQVDMVNNPSHYTSHPSGIECIDVTRHFSFNLGNAMKYIWRCDLKKDAIEDLKKAVFYLNDEIKLRESKLNPIDFEWTEEFK